MNIKSSLCVALLSAGFISATPATAQDTPDQDKPNKTPEQLKERLKLQRTSAMSSSIQFKLMPTLSKLQSKAIPLTHQQIIYTILANTNESASHQMRGQSENQLYTHDDGREAVYDKDGELVKNGYNDGSYNYAHPKDEPLLHFSLDTSPWLLWGMGEDDPTTIEERTYAYMGDLEGGIRRANAMLPLDTLPEDHKWPEISQMQTLAIFAKAIELGDAEEIYTLFENDHELTDKEIIRVLTKLNAGFDIVYNIPDP